MKEIIIAILLAIAFMIIPTNTMAQIKWSDYDKQIEKEIAATKATLPMGGEDDGFIITDIEKRGKVIITTMESKDELGWIAMAESMGGVEKFKALMQRQYAESDLLLRGVTLAGGYTLRYRHIDKGKEVCTVDVNKMIIHSMIGDYDVDNLPEYQVAPMSQELFEKFIEYEKYKRKGGYPPALTQEELHLIREFGKYFDKEQLQLYLTVDEENAEAGKVTNVK